MYLDKIIFTYENIELQLPYSSNLEINREYEDYEFTNILGQTYNIGGSPKLLEFEITGIISNKNYAFYSKKAPKELSDYVDFFNRIRKEKKPVLLTIGNDNVTIIQMECLVSFSYSNFDKVGDIPFIIKVKEFKGLEQ